MTNDQAKRFMSEANQLLKQNPDDLGSQMLALMKSHMTSDTMNSAIRQMSGRK